MTKQNTALASGSGDHAELARGKACGDRMIATADALMPWLKNYPPSTRRERAIEAANAAAAASCGPLLAENAALRVERRNIVSHATMGETDGDGLSVNEVSVRITALRNQMHTRATEAERALAEHRITADLLVSTLKSDKAEAERKLAEAVGHGRNLLYLADGGPSTGNKVHEWTEAARTFFSKEAERG